MQSYMCKSKWVSGVQRAVEVVVSSGDRVSGTAVSPVGVAWCVCIRIGISIYAVRRRIPIKMGVGQVSNICGGAKVGRRVGPAHPKGGVETLPSVRYRAWSERRAFRYFDSLLSLCYVGCVVVCGYT
jgi:hypothetical protein